MPVVHIAHEDLSVTICPVAGLAILPTLGIYQLRYARVRDVEYLNSNRVLPGLPWERLIQFEMPEITDVLITLEDEQNMPILIHFQGFQCRREHRLAQVIRIQKWWRVASYRKKVLVTAARLKAVARLQVLAMGTHPRLGANSPMITVDFLCMLAEIWRL